MNNLFGGDDDDDEEEDTFAFKKPVPKLAMPVPQAKPQPATQSKKPNLFDSMVSNDNDSSF
jgi:hypothetical protein